MEITRKRIEKNKKTDKVHNNCFSLTLYCIHTEKADNHVAAFHLQHNSRYSLVTLKE